MAVNVESANIEIVIDFAKFDTQLAKVKQKLAAVKNFEINAKINTNQQAGQNFQKASVAPIVAGSALIGSSILGIKQKLGGLKFKLPTIDTSKLEKAKTGMSKLAQTFNNVRTKATATISDVNAKLKNLTEATKRAAAAGKVLDKGLRKSILKLHAYGAAIKAVNMLKITGASFASGALNAGVKTASGLSTALRKIGPVASVALGAVGRSFIVLGKVAAAVARGISKAWSIAMATLRRVATAAVIGLAVAFRGIKQQLEDDAAFANLDQSLQRTSSQIGVTIQQADALAEALDRSTDFELPQLRQAVAQLSTFTNIKGFDLFEDTLRTAADLSTVMGTDIKSSVLQLAKALQDPIKGINALTRSGVSFTEEQKGIITNLVETNRLLEAQQFILQTIKNQGIGGQAQASASPLIQLRKAFDELVESFGTYISRFFQLGDTITTLGDNMRALGDYIVSFTTSNAFRQWSAKTIYAFSTAIAYIQFFAANIKNLPFAVANSFGIVGRAVLGAIRIIGAAIKWIANKIIQFGKFLGASITEDLKDLANDGGASFDKLTERLEAAKAKLKDRLESNEIIDLKVPGAAAVVINTNQIDGVNSAVEETNKKIEKQIQLLSGASSLWEGFASKIKVATGNVAELGAINVSPVKINSPVATASGLNQSMTGVITEIRTQTTQLLTGIGQVTTAIKDLSLSPAL